MRHTFAVWSLRAGVPIQDVGREMGHADVSITFRTYGQWADEMGTRAANLRAAWGREIGRRATEALDV
jgi:integrase